MLYFRMAGHTTPIADKISLEKAMSKPPNTQRMPWVRWEVTNIGQELVSEAFSLTSACY